MIQLLIIIIVLVAIAALLISVLIPRIPLPPPWGMVLQCLVGLVILLIILDMLLPAPMLIRRW